MRLMLTTILIALLLANIRTFALFGMDKIRSIESRRRIPETTLLRAAFFGGILGAYLGRFHFRHKINKRSFSKQLHLIALAEAGIVGALALAFFRPG